MSTAYTPVERARRNLGHIAIAGTVVAVVALIAALLAKGAADQRERVALYSRALGDTFARGGDYGFTIALFVIVAVGVATLVVALIVRGTLPRS